MGRDAEQRALVFIRNVAKTKTERPNDLWSTLFHVSQDALDGHNRTLDELRPEPDTMRMDE